MTLRIQDNDNKIYEKINIALAFSGVILTIMLTYYGEKRLNREQ